MLNQIYNSTHSDEIDEQLDKVTFIEYYRELIKVYDSMLEVVFSHKYIAPDPFFSLTFVKLVKELSLLQKAPLLKSLPNYNFNDYNNLTVNVEWMKSNYPEKRKLLLQFRSKLENLFIDVCKIEGNLTDYMEQDLKYYYTLISEHKKIVGTREAKNNNLLQFTASESNKKSVYLILDQNINKWVNKKVIMKKIKITYDDFRSIISQLRKEIVRQGLNTKLSIDNDKKGSYKLTKII